MSREIITKITDEVDFQYLKEHVEENKKIKEKYKYCIQPLVVMRKGRRNVYDVVDGQQRITTITIILSALKLCKSIYGSTEQQKIPIQISYASRPGSKDLLQFLWDMEADKSEEEIKYFNQNDFHEWIWDEFRKRNDFKRNIDFDHIINAFRESVDFFLAIMQDFRQEFGKSRLMEYIDYLQFVLLKCTEVIWYIADPDYSEQVSINERKIFANFNTGKLPLTNAELIKAMFMNPSNYGEGGKISDRQIVIAEKWDAIETALHHPDFWSFVPHPGQYDYTGNLIQYKETRIDIIFDFLVMRKWLGKNRSGNYRNDISHYIQQYKQASLDPYHTFNQIEKWIETELFGATSPEAKRDVMDKYWNEVREIYTSIREFYDDDGRNSENSSKQYNLIGFYIYACNTRKGDGTFYTSYKNNNVINDVGKYVYLSIFGFLNLLAQTHRNTREKLVKEEIKELLGIQKGKEIPVFLREISYDKNNSPIAILLLLYNIALLNASGGVGNRFHFSSYAMMTW